MATKTGEFYSNLISIAPNFWEAWIAKSEVKKIKKEMEQLKVFVAEADDKDKKLDISGVKNALNNFFKVEGSIEKHTDDAEIRAFIMEFRTLRELESLKTKLRSLPNIVDATQASEARRIVEKFNQMVAQIDIKITEVYNTTKDQGLSKENRLRDFMLQELLAVYFQTRMAIKVIRKDADKIKANIKDIESDIARLGKKNEKNKDKLLDALGKSLNKVIDETADLVSNATFAEKMLTRVRIRFVDLFDDRVAFVQKLKKDGFPEADLNKLESESIVKVQARFKADYEKEYQQSRVVLQIARNLRI